MIGFEQTIQAQFANSPTLVQLITNMNTYVDPSADLDAFYDLIWNVDTAQGYGLDVWGRIVGVPRVLQVSASKYWGFEEATSISADPFGQSPFYAGTPTTTNYALSDSAFRTLIFAKALANISDGSIPSINQLLLNLFPGRGNCYVTDGENMSITYTFAFSPPLSPVEVSIASSGIIPKPAGVSFTVVQL